MGSGNYPVGSGSGFDIFKILKQIADAAKAASTAQAGTVTTANTCTAPGGGAVRGQTIGSYSGNKVEVEPAGYTVPRRNRDSMGTTVTAAVYNPNAAAATANSSSSCGGDGDERPTTTAASLNP